MDENITTEATTETTETTEPTTKELAEQVATLKEQVAALQAIAGETEYELRYSGEQLDAICDKVSALTVSPAQINQLQNYRQPRYGKVSFKPQMSGGGSTSIANALTGFEDPLVYLSIEGAAHNAVAGWQATYKSLVIAIMPIGDNALDTGKTYTVDYMIVEGA